MLKFKFVHKLCGMYSERGLSWVMSQTVAPLMCMTMLPEPKQRPEDGDVYGGRFYQIFRGLLAKAIRFRLPFRVGMVVLRLT
jgi:multidrug efflux pump subunit AcrB